MSSQTSRVILDRHEVHVNGRTFGISEDAFKRIEHTVYPGTKLIMPIIDRDADIFAKYIWPHLIGYKLYLKDTDKDTLWRILSDADFYRLPELREQVVQALGSAALSPEEINTKIEEETTRIKGVMESLTKLLGTFLGPYFGINDFGDDIEQLDAEIKACARDSVESGDTFSFGLNAQQKLFMALFIRVYLKIVSNMRQRQEQEEQPEHVQEFVIRRMDPGFQMNWNFGDNNDVNNHDD